MEIAHAVQRLYNDGAKVIALDVIFGNSIAHAEAVADGLD